MVQIFEMGETESKEAAGNTKVDKREEEDPTKVLHVRAVTWDGETVKLTVEPMNYLGKGAFGTVKKILLVDESSGTEGVAALKNPLGPERLNSMEKAILLEIRHKNVCNLLYFFVDKLNRSHLILEYVEGGDLFQFMRTHFVHNVGLGEYLELFAYQLWRAIAYCHANAIIHRDLKPENLLVNPELGTLKLTDFGCSVLLRDEDAGKEMMFYVGTLVFRAPELILGSTRYSAKCDIWSAAIVMSEMVLGKPIFYDATAPKAHMKKIADHIGFPTELDFGDMGVEPIKRPSHLKTHSIQKRLAHVHLPPPSDKPMLEKLLEETIIYSPAKRPTAWEVLVHPFFRWLREPGLVLPNGKPYPDLFDFSEFEMASMPDAVRANFNIAF